MASMESDIFTNLKTYLETIPWVAHVETENPRLLISEWPDDKQPVIQFYDAGRIIEHANRRILNRLTIEIQIGMKVKVDDSTVSQLILFDRMEDVERKIADNVQLGLGSASSSQGEMVHVKYLNAITDLHSLGPYYIAVMNFEVDYYKPYTGTC
jgi:hypothetical protein